MIARAFPLQQKHLGAVQPMQPTMQPMQPTMQPMQPTMQLDATKAVGCIAHPIIIELRNTQDIPEYAVYDRVARVQ